MKALKELNWEKGWGGGGGVSNEHKNKQTSSS